MKTIESLNVGYLNFNLNKSPLNNPKLRSFDLSH